MRMLSKWPWISRCGDYWLQAELSMHWWCMPNNDDDDVVTPDGLRDLFLKRFMWWMFNVLSSQWPRERASISPKADAFCCPMEGRRLSWLKHYNTDCAQGVCCILAAVMINAKLSGGMSCSDLIICGHVAIRPLCNWCICLSNDVLQVAVADNSGVVQVFGIKKRDVQASAVFIIPVLHYVSGHWSYSGNTVQFCIIM